jgi:serine/threonine-protein kinase
MHLNDAPPDPRNVAPDRAIPAPLAAITIRALAKTRESRFQNARLFSDELDLALREIEGRAAPAAAPKSATPCRACGALSPLGQKFCGDCGAPIASTGSKAALRPSAAQPAPRADAAVLPLLARDSALEWLGARRHQAGAMLAAAYVIGEAGSGKTRLLDEFLARCKATGDRVVRVGPDPAWAKVGDSAVRNAIRALADLHDAQLEEKAWPGATPEARLGLEVLFCAQPSASLPARERRRALADALRWALARAAEIAGEATVVLAVDDLDFVDGSSRIAFADVLSEPPVVDALVIVAYSPTTRPAGEPLEGEAWTLEPLPHDSFAPMLPAPLAADARPLPPLHVEQLLAWAQESSEPPPERLADLVARRTVRLSPDARHVLHALAVWGDDATPAVLRGMLPASVDLTTALEVLDRARLVAIDERALRITHPLVRRIVFSSIPAGRKRELFASTEALRPDAPLEVRAKQAMHGGSAFEALSLLDALSVLRASHGDQAGSVSALRHALDVARRELHRGELDDPVVAMLVFARKLAEALATSEQWTDAEGVLREALGNAPPTSEHRARLLGVLARVASARSRTGDARRYLDEAMRVARQSDARELLPMLETLEKAITAVA